MDARDLPPDVARFVLEKIDAVPELEALLLLKQTLPQAWSEEALAARLYISQRASAAILARLVRAGLVAEAAHQYRFNADSPDAGVVAQLDAVYRTQMTAIARLIHAKPPAALRDFARAFNVKPDKGGKP